VETDGQDDELSRCDIIYHGQSTRRDRSYEAKEIEEGSMLRYRGRARPRVQYILAASLATRDWLGLGCHGRPATLMHRCCMSCCKRCRGRCFGRGKGAANTNPWMSRRAAGQMFRTNSPRHAGMPRPLWGDWPLDDPLSAHHLQELHQGSLRCLLVPARCAHHLACRLFSRAPPSFSIVVDQALVLATSLSGGQAADHTS
jgi:hypothetical protein